MPSNAPVLCGTARLINVFLAQSLDAPVQVALKKISNVNSNLENARIVLREVCILRRLCHPHVIRLHDAFWKPSPTGALQLVLYVDHYCCTSVTTTQQQSFIAPSPQRIHMTILESFTKFLAAACIKCLTNRKSPLTTICIPADKHGLPPNHTAPARQLCYHSVRTNCFHAIYSASISSNLPSCCVPAPSHPV